MVTVISIEYQMTFFQCSVYSHAMAILMNPMQHIFNVKYSSVISVLSLLGYQLTCAGAVTVGAHICGYFNVLTKMLKVKG